MGPEASSYFYDLLLDIAQEKYGAVQDTDYPPIVIYNLPLEGFDETGIRDEEAVRAQLIEGVKKLESFGARYIVIACNTVHQFYEEMQTSVSVPIINIVSEAAAEASKRGYKQVLLLSSESTNKMRLYANACEALGLATISADTEDQKALNQVILHVMAGTQGAADIQAVDAIVKRLEGSADAVLLGCTELPLAVREGDLDVPVLNANRIVLEAALKKIYA
jgi:aspartate racemase